MNEKIQKPVVRNHLNQLPKIMRTPSLILAAALRKNPMIAITQMDRNGEHGGELNKGDSAFAESLDGEESTVGEL